MVSGRSVSPLLFFCITRPAKSDNFPALHGPSNFENRSFGYFPRSLLEAYSDSQNQYIDITKSLTIAEGNLLLRGTSASIKHFCILEQKCKRGVFEAILPRKSRSVPKEKQKDRKVFKFNELVPRITKKNNGATDIPSTISARYGLIDQGDFFSKVVASADMDGYYLFRKGEYAYNRSTSNEYPFGSIRRLELYNEGAVSILYLRPSINEKIIVSDFAEWYSEPSQRYSSVSKIRFEGVRNHGLLNVPTDGFFNTTYTLSNGIREQMAIATLLSFIQGELERSQENLDQLNQLRSGLMQKPFI